MLVLKDKELFEIEDSRVTLEVAETIKSEQIGYDLIYHVYVDGQFYIDAVVLYVDNTQYVLLQKSLNDLELDKIFNCGKNTVIMSAGSKVQEEDRVVFKDFREKVRRGCSFFYQALSEFDAEEKYKDFYFPIEVRL